MNNRAAKINPGEVDLKERVIHINRVARFVKGGGRCTAPPPGSGHPESAHPGRRRRPVGCHTVANEGSAPALATPWPL